MLHMQLLEVLEALEEACYTLETVMDFYKEGAKLAALCKEQLDDAAAAMREACENT